MSDGHAYEDRFHQRLQQLEDIGLRRHARVVDTQADGTCVVDGQQAINFGGNDYLNLAHDLTALQDVQTKPCLPTGATASALVCGRSRWHAALETALAEFEATQAALLFPSGFAANVGLLSALVQNRDAVFCDRDNHASIVDAVRASSGQLLVYRHDRLTSLEKALRRRRAEFDSVYIVTDGVFSMDGVVAPLADLCDIADRYDAAVIVDEAHGTGVLGEHGRGAADHCGVEDRVLVRIGTMSKAMGGIGGFAVGSRTLIELLRNTARTQFFSTALPPAVCVAMLQAVQLMRDQPKRRCRILELANYARQAVADHGLQTVPGGIAPIVPILIPDTQSLLRISRQLLDAGYFVPAIRPPTVPQGTDRLRISLNIKHTEQHIDDLLQAIAAALP